MEVEETTADMRCAMLQSKCHQQTSSQFFLQAGCPSCRPTNTNSVKALKGIFFCYYYYSRAQGISDTEGEETKKK